VAQAGTGGTGGTGGTINVPCDVALMTALETDTHSNVLSAPTLLTADNEEAMIVVGQNLPFVGSAAANAGLPGQIFNSVERQNVGITLDIVPQVSEGDYVRLDLYEEVSNVLGSTINNPLGPTTTIRSASTTVLVQNHRTAVIGGLLSNNDTYQRQGVPWVSDIPVLGNLFSSTSTDKNKDNLLVFLTPHVVRSKNELRSLALDERQKFVNSLGARGNGLTTEIWWTPTFPYKSGLTGQSAKELTDAYTSATKRPWTQPIGYQHALFEVAIDILKRTKSIDPKAILDAIVATDYHSMVGPVKWTGQPVKNVTKTPLVAGQWQRKGNAFELVITENKSAPDIPVGGKLQLLS